jgi:8-oxo-dGTP pyrophosphatase MutT (NUDIX family)
MSEQHFLGKVATKAIIVKGEKILLARDHRNETIWELPGGRINVDESIEMALKREVLEELGVAVTIKDLIYSEQIIHTGDGSPHLFITCTASLVDENQPIHVPSEELAEIKWVDRSGIGELEVYGDQLRAINAYWK